MNDNSLSRIEWFLGGLLVVLLIIVMTLAGLFWFRSTQTPASGQTQTTVIGPPPSYIGQTAIAANSSARTAAETWHADAVLIKSSATWHQGATEEDIRTGRSAWSFTYYSPTQNQVAIISVVEGQAQVVSETQIDQALSPRPSPDWHIDSPQAIHRMLQEGGERFINSERITTLTMTLSTDNPSGRMEWFISLFGGQTGNSFTVLLDATSGEILDVIQSP